MERKHVTLTPQGAVKTVVLSAGTARGTSLGLFTVLPLLLPVSYSRLVLRALGLSLGLLSSLCRGAVSISSLFPGPGRPITRHLSLRRAKRSQTPVF
ncbi:unnamed protein product [Boreogadus saida]